MKGNMEENIKETEMNEEVKTEKEEKKEKKAKKKDKTAELQAQLEEQQNQYLRLAAEYDNFRKRTQREKEALNGDIKAYILGELLPVFDNFERALGNKTADLETYSKGVEMIFTQLGDIFKKLGVEPFGEAGEAFDPQKHNAVMHIESEDFGDSVVAQVFAKGYKMGDKIIRCATVQVAN